MATRRKPKGTPRNENPFKGDDPFSKTLASAWSIPGELAQGFSDVASGRRKIGLDEVVGVLAPAALAAAGMATARTGAGRRAVKKVAPVAPRIAAASRRVAAKSANNARFLKSESDYLRNRSYEFEKRSRDLASPEYAGTDYYTTQSRMTDPLFDTWEHTQRRVGSGESASSLAERLRSSTGRKVVAQRVYDYGMDGVRYRLDPTSADLEMSKKTDADAAQLRRQSYATGDAASRAEYRSNRSNASAEIKRRLAALQRAKRNR